MLKHFCRQLLFVVAAVFLFGCASRINMPEILQQPKDKTIRTSCNLWYDEKNNINCMNYQTGKLLPWGTEVTPIDTTRDKIIFMANGVKFTVNYYPSWTMIPVESFVRQTFTIKSRAELSKGIAPRILDEIDRGRIVKGMTRDEVTLCCGVPVACRTPSLTNDTWIYWSDQFVTIRVVFKNNRVVDILSLK